MSEMSQPAKDLVKHGSALFAEKRLIDELYQEIATVFYPERADFTTPLTLGSDLASHLDDGSPSMTRRELGEMMSSLIRPTTEPWFDLGVKGMDDPEPGSAEARALDFLTKRTRDVIYRTNCGFTRAMKLADHDYATFGTAIVNITPYNMQELLVRECHIKDCTWREDYAGRVDTVFRKVKLTLRQMKRLFGKVPERWQEMLDKDPDQKVEIWHVCMPMLDWKDMGGKAEGPSTSPFASIWLAPELNELLLAKGVKRQLYVVSRWMRFGTTQWSISPASTAALPNGRMLQRMAAAVINAAEKTVDPPLVATQNAIKSMVDLRAGGITWIDAQYDERLGEALRPLDLGKNAQLGIEMLAYVTQQIERAFFINKLQLPTSQAKTAYETARLVEQYVRDALPIFETLENDYIQPILDNIIGTITEIGGYGDLGSLPESIVEGELEIRFNNPLRQSLDKKKVQAFVEAAQIIATAAQFDPNATAEYDLPAMHRDAVEATGAPPEWIVDPQISAQRREQAAQEQQQAAATAQMGAEAEVAGQVAGAAGQAREAGLMDLLGGIEPEEAQA